MRGLTTLAASAAALALAGTFSASAQEAENNDVTAVLMPQRGGSDTSPVIQLVEGLSSAQACLDLAWVAAITPPDWSSGSAVNVSCLQGGDIVAAQTCYKGACNPIEPASLRP